jgi:hypothetical protein
LLRRVALSRFPRDEVASLSGQDWIDFLTQASQHKTVLENEIAQLLIQAPYRQHYDNDIAPLLNFTERWINALPNKHQWSKHV